MKRLNLLKIDDSKGIFLVNIEELNMINNALNFHSDILCKVNRHDTDWERIGKFSDEVGELIHEWESEEDQKNEK
jgi:hypothetical protein